MASQTQGIQQLLAAEKRAAEKVAEARKRKLNFNYNLLFCSTHITHAQSITHKLLSCAAGLAAPNVFFIHAAFTFLPDFNQLNFMAAQ